MQTSIVLCCVWIMGLWAENLLPKSMDASKYGKLSFLRSFAPRLRCKWCWKKGATCSSRRVSTSSYCLLSIENDTSQYARATVSAVFSIRAKIKNSKRIGNERTIDSFDHNSNDCYLYGLVWKIWRPTMKPLPSYLASFPRIESASIKEVRALAVVWKMILWSTNCWVSRLEKERNNETNTSSFHPACIRCP